METHNKEQKNTNMQDLEFWESVYLSVVKNGATTHDAISYADIALNARKQRQSDAGKFYTDDRLNRLLLKSFTISGHEKECFVWGFLPDRIGVVHVLYSEEILENVKNVKVVLSTIPIEKTSLIEILKDHG